MPDPRISLKQPWLAGILAYLLPGAGHLYQGRFLKAGIYAVCILGLFFTGMAMAEWKAVQAPPKGRGRGQVQMLKFAAQAGVGLPALYGLVQRERYYRPDNQLVTNMDEPFSAPFSGFAQYRDDQGIREGDVRGTIFLEPAVGPFGGSSITGRLDGTFDREPVTFQLGTHTELGKPIEASEQRGVRAAIVNPRGEPIGGLSGHIPRPFLNWYQAPMDEHHEQELHRRLGKFHELAMVFTWIAGLLNVLAIWDAVEGPAYGYGDEDQSGDAETPTPATA